MDGALAVKLKSLLRSAHEDGWGGWRMDQRLYRKVRLDRATSKEKDWLTGQEARDMLVSAHTLELWTTGAMALMIYCGLRHEEAKQLSWARIDVDPVKHAPCAAMISLPPHSTKERRLKYVPVPKEVMALMPDEGIGRVFPGLTNYYVTKHLKLACEHAGIGKHITPHCLRHTAAHIFDDAGVSMPKIQKLLGHASITTTQRYLQRSGKDMAEEVAGVASSLFT